jgi:hypothetical protein
MRIEGLLLATFLIMCGMVLILWIMLDDSHAMILDLLGKLEACRL